MNTLPVNILNKYFEKSFQLFSKLNNHENIDDFCENETFGLLFSTEYDSERNRKFYTSLLKTYIIRNKDNSFSSY